MADILHLRAGEFRQLRSPAQGVARWTSNAPAIVTVTDEDLVAGRPGGLLQALKPGRARITAFDYDNKPTRGQWEVEVEAAPLATIRVEKNAVATLPSVPGVTQWTIANPRVAQVTGDGRIRGLSPGVTVARGQGAAASECSIEVTGTLDAGVNQSLNLAEYFSSAVTAWRSSSPADVPIDSGGTVMTGDRARTVEISAELAPGRTFQFRLRIAGAPPTAQPNAAVELTPRPPSALTPSPPAPATTGAMHSPALPQGAPAAPEQRHAVEAHLRAAEACLQENDWTQAGAELTAARLTAVMDPDLAQRVDELGARLRARVREHTAAELADAIRMVAAGDSDNALGHLDSTPIPRDLTPCVEGLRRLAALAQQAQSAGDDQSRERLEQALAAVWDELARAGMFPALAPLAEFGLQYGDRVVPLLVDTFGDPTLSGMSTDVRRALGKSLADAGVSSLETVVSRLADPTTPPAVASLLLSLLPDLDLRRHASILVRRYAALSPTDRARLVAQLAAFHTNSATTLLDLLAGVLTRLPVDLRLAHDLQRRVGASELERIARRWAAGGHPAAKTVLQGLYDYGPGVSHA